MGCTTRSFDVAECRSCHHGFTRLDKEDYGRLSGFYPDDYWGGQPRADRNQREKIRRLRRLKQGGSLLDVGCGKGDFLMSIDESRWELYGIELSPNAAERARRATERATIVSGDTLDVVCEWADSSFDAVTMWATLEHLPDPVKTLIEIRRLLRPDGVLLFSVPNMASWEARFFGNRWFHLDVPRHLHHFSMPVLSALLNRLGFTVISIDFFSTEHNYHGVKQSLKKVLKEGSSIGSFAYCFLKPLLWPFAVCQSFLRRGATITVSAVRKP